MDRRHVCLFVCLLFVCLFVCVCVCVFAHVCVTGWDVVPCSATRCRVRSSGCDVLECAACSACTCTYEVRHVGVYVCMRVTCLCMCLCVCVCARMCFCVRACVHSCTPAAFFCMEHDKDEVSRPTAGDCLRPAQGRARAGYRTASVRKRRESTLVQAFMFYGCQV